MTKQTASLFLFVCLLAFAGATHAQTFYVGGGPSIQSDLPHGAMNATVGIAAGQKTMFLLDYSAHGTAQDLKAGAPLTYRSTAGVRQVVATAALKGSTVEFFLLAEAGATIAITATGFSGAAGGGLTLHPGAHPNWGFSGALQGEYSPVNPGGGRKVLFVQAGYTFKVSK